MLVEIHASQQRKVRRVPSVKQRIEATVGHDWGLENMSILPRRTISLLVGKVKPSYREPRPAHSKSLPTTALGCGSITNWSSTPAWQPQCQEVTGSFSPSATRLHLIRLEYFERTGATTIQLNWTSSLFDSLIGPDYLRPHDQYPI